MDNRLKKSFFIHTAGVAFYVGEDNDIHRMYVDSVLSMYDSDRSGFEKIISGFKDGVIGVCKDDEYLCLDAESDETTVFRHVPKNVFKQLMKDPETIRLRYKSDDIMLLQYNPECVAI